MLRVFVLTAAGLALGGFLGGCSSMPSMDLFSSAPANVTVQLESKPPGADARTSLGPSCKTPCSVSIPVAETFTVDYTLERHLPQTVTVRTTSTSGGFGSSATVVTEPNPVFAELQPTSPAKHGKPAAKKRKPKPAADPAAAPAQDDSAFPPPPH